MGASVKKAKKSKKKKAKMPMVTWEELQISTDIWENPLSPKSARQLGIMSYNPYRR